MEYERVLSSQVKPPIHTSYLLNLSIMCPKATFRVKTALPRDFTLAQVERLSARTTVQTSIRTSTQMTAHEHTADVRPRQWEGQSSQQAVTQTSHCAASARHNFPTTSSTCDFWQAIPDPETAKGSSREGGPLPPKQAAPEKERLERPLLIRRPQQEAPVTASDGESRWRFSQRRIT